MSIGLNIPLLTLCSALAGLLAAAAWGGLQQPGSRTGAGAVAASAFAAGALARSRLLAESPAPREAAGSEAGDPAAALAEARLEAAAARAETHAIQSSVAHDLRSPVGAILNFVTVLELDHGARLDEDARQVMKRIRSSAEAGLSLLDALSRLAGVARAPLRLAPLDVEPLLRRAFAEAQGGGRSRCELSIGELPGRAVADADLLRAAFVELFGNALKFSCGRRSPQIGVGGRTESDGSLVYWVSDDGVGFDMRFTSKLFGVFERLHGRDEFPGTGIGLAIVRKIAERHGGRAWAEGEPERGARVFFSLPAPQEDV